ncbi:hypothetical protein ITP53_22265, partial [Nonomuraea sp. K274]
PSPAASPTVAPTVTARPAVEFVGFVDTVREPRFDLPAESRRTGVRRYALGHLVAGGDGCVPKWTGALDRGGDPLPGRIARLRAVSGEATPVFGGPGGRELAAACTRPGALAAAYSGVAGAFGSGAVDFEVRDGEAGATVLRRAKAIRALQRERDLRVTFTLSMKPYGLAASDVAMLRTTRRAGAEIDTVNLLATVEPPGGDRLRGIAAGVRAASGQIARAQALAGPEEAWRRIALTPVLGRARGLTETEARKLSAYAARHGLAWLSLRGDGAEPAASRILWRGLT